MSKRIAGPEIERLIQLLSKVPGLGPRSARRAALHLIKKKEQLLGPLSVAMADAVEKVRVCSTCGNVDTTDPCTVCTDPRRDTSTIVVVEDVSDLWALERAAALNASYHVLGGVMSPLDGVGPDDLSISSLVSRVAAGGVVVDRGEDHPAAIGAVHHEGAADTERERSHLDDGAVLDGERRALRHQHMAGCVVDDA